MKFISYEYLVQDGLASVEGEVYSLADIETAMGVAPSPEEMLMLEEEGDILDIMSIGVEESAATDSLDEFETFFSLQTK